MCFTLLVKFRHVLCSLITYFVAEVSSQVIGTHSVNHNLNNSTSVFKYLISVSRKRWGVPELNLILNKTLFSITYFLHLTWLLNIISLFTGLIFTSPRSAKAVSQCLQDKSLKELGWKSSFVVGETTGEIVKEQLGIDVQGSKSGNISALVDFIINGNIFYNTFN